MCPGGMQTADTGGTRGICHSTVPQAGRKEGGRVCVGSPGGARRLAVPGGHRVYTEGPLWSVGTVARPGAAPCWAAPFGP